MIRVELGALRDRAVEAVLRPVQSDFSPVSAASRDLAAAAGPVVEEKLERLGTLPLGGAVLTPAGDLSADFLIHVVVSSAAEPMTTTSVRKAVRNGLRRAADMGIESLALPPVGIGVGLTEPEEAARALCEILRDHLSEGLPPLHLTIVVNSSYEQSIFKGMLAEIGAAHEGDGSG